MIQKLKLLIAEDDDRLLDLYSAMLRKKGFSVITSRDGVEAVMKFMVEDPDIVLLDYNMPRANGLEAAAEILSLNPSTRILMLTADYAVLKEAKRIGIDLFLTKPVALKELVSSLIALSSVRPYTFCDSSIPMIVSPK